VGKVAVVFGSSLDLPLLTPGIELLEELGIAVDPKVLSAHRTPYETLDFATNAPSRGYSVLIAGAGGAAHLPGMLASATRLPVIGVPIGITKLAGVDALYSIAQVPPGTPVATVGIEAAVNAALLAARILALADPALGDRLDRYRLQGRDAVLATSLDTE
jgi:5-(carboxyamino)imidazole ribonucleotide mutase